MADINSLVYDVVEGKTASSLDRIRNLFFSLSKRMEKEGSPVKSERIDNSFTFYSGMDLAFFNQAVVFDGNKESRDKVLQRIASWNIKNIVFLGGAGLKHAEHLKTIGYVNVGAGPLMGYAVDSRYKDFELRSGLTAVRTETEAQFDVNVPLLSAAFELSEEIARSYASSLLKDKECYRYVLFDNGTAVSTSLFMKDGDFVGCFDVATPAEHQRKGYGEELMKFMLKEQYELGSRLVMLQSSAAGEVLYRRMGYQIIEYLQSWQLTEPELLIKFEAERAEGGGQ